MKYFTKDYFKLLYTINYTEDFKPIEDRPYTEAEIKQFYREALWSKLQYEKDLYNTEPSLFFFEEDDLDLNEILIVDGDRSFHPASWKDYRDYVQAEYEAERWEFDHRPPFDGQKVMDDFRTDCRERVEMIKESYPPYVLEEADLSLLAIGLMPRPLYKKLLKIDQAKEKALQKAERQAQKAQARMQRNEHVQNFTIYGELTSFNHDEEDYIMTLWNDDTKQRQTIVFKQGIVFENELNEESVFGLAHELYPLEKGGYEVHMMFYGDDFHALTLQCQDIDQLIDEGDTIVS